MDLGGGDFLTAGGATGLVVLLGKYVWDTVRGRKERLEERAESELERKVDLLLTKVTGIETEQVRGIERSAALDAVVREVKGRIDGISANYGQRLGELEQRIAGIEGKRGRR